MAFLYSKPNPMDRIAFLGRAFSDLWPNGPISDRDFQKKANDLFTTVVSAGEEDQCKGNLASNDDEIIDIGCTPPPRGPLALAEVDPVDKNVQELLRKCFQSGPVPRLALSSHGCRKPRVAALTRCGKVAPKGPVARMKTLA